MHSENSVAAALFDVVKRFGARAALDVSTCAAALALLLMSAGATVGEVVLDVVQWVGWFILSVLGVVPFCGIGVLMGGLVKGLGASAVLNLIYLPMSFLSGRWIPLEVLPHTLAQFASVWPAYHLAMFAQYTIGAGGELLPHVLDLAGVGILFFALSRRALRKVR